MHSELRATSRFLLLKLELYLVTLVYETSSNVLRRTVIVLNGIHIDENDIRQDCGMHSQEVNGDVETNFVEVLLEYLKVCKITEALKKQRRVDMALLESMKIASRYQKEAKLNTQSWEATEKVEMTSVSQTKLTALWELRVH